MGSGNIPREIYIFGFLAFYIIFGLIYLAMQQTLYTTGVTSDCVDTETRDYNVVGLGAKDSGLFDNVITKIKCSGEESDGIKIVNYFMLFISTLIVVMLIVLLLHG